MTKNTKHPMLLKRTIFPTIEITKVAKSIQQWMESESSGGYLTGNPRGGKSKCLKFINRHSEKLLGVQAPTALIITPNPDQGYMSDKSFYTNLLIKLEHEYAQQGDTTDRKLRAIEYILDKCQEYDEQKFILFIDEAQWLNKVQLSTLCDFQNQLEDKDIELFAIMMGTPLLDGRYKELIASGDMHIAERFFVNDAVFRGICDSDTLKSILSYIDHKAIWPAGSGISFTAHYLPQAVSAGWSLSSQTERLWFLFERVFREDGHEKIEELPFTPIRALIRQILIKGQRYDRKEFELSDDFYQELIDTVCKDNFLSHIRSSNYKKPL